MEIKNHLLEGNKVNFKEATSYGRRNTIVPDSIIIHYTAGPSGSSTVKYFSRSNARLSAHLVIHEDGQVTQMVPFDKKAYHAGNSYYDGRSSFNNFSVGIEISNPGYLTKKSVGYVTWWEAKKSNPTPVPEDMVFVGQHRNPGTRSTHWHKYTQEQINAVEEVCKTLYETYEIKYILGHEEVAPKRKVDPGPAFPLDEMRERIFNQKPKTLAELLKGSVSPKNIVEKGFVTTRLNFREGPSIETSKLTDPIDKNSRVGILGEKGDWINIIHKISGWVKKEDLEHDNTDDEGDGIILVDKIVLKSSAKNGRTLKHSLRKNDKIYFHDQYEDLLLVSAYIPGWVMTKYVKK